MAAIGAIPPDALSGFTVLGELGLDGSIAAVAGVLPAAIGANSREEGLICPASCGAEAAWASPDIQIVAANSLIQIANHFKGTQVLSRPSPKVHAQEATQLDLRDIKGQESAKLRRPRRLALWATASPQSTAVATFAGTTWSDDASPRPRQPGGNEFSLRFANHKPPEHRGLAISEWRSMLRFKILVSAVPLILAALFARGGLLPGSHPCIAVADTSVEISDLPWHADLRVAFTDDPAVATVRVQVSDSADAADFAVVDDAGATEPGACEAGPATRFVTVSTNPRKRRPRHLPLARRSRRLSNLRQIEAVFDRATRQPSWSAPAADTALSKKRRSSFRRDEPPPAFPATKTLC